MVYAHDFVATPSIGIHNSWSLSFVRKACFINLLPSLHPLSFEMATPPVMLPMPRHHCPTPPMPYQSIYTKVDA